MQLNSTETMAFEISKKIAQKFGNKISSRQIYDVVDEASHRAFKISFIAYDYFVVLFNYELDIIGFSIEVGAAKYISLSKNHNCYSGVNMDSYLEEIKNELELRIPDKFLEARGWK